MPESYESPARSDIAQDCARAFAAAHITNVCGALSDRASEAYGTGPEDAMANLFDDLPTKAEAEIFTELLTRRGVRIERIVSTGQATPVDRPYDQAHDEWVLLLEGSAGLWLEGEGERVLRAGDHLLIPAHRRHRVTFTAPDQPTVWLAVHFVP